MPFPLHKYLSDCAINLGAELGDVKQTVDISQNWDTTKRCYSYSDVLRMTNNFERMLGEGGFGRVYYGKIGNDEVAVKMLSPRSVQGYQQFQAEVWNFDNNYKH